MTGTVRWFGLDSSFVIALDDVPVRSWLGTFLTTYLHRDLRTVLWRNATAHTHTLRMPAHIRDAGTRYGPLTPRLPYATTPHRTLHALLPATPVSNATHNILCAVTCACLPLTLAPPCRAPAFTYALRLPRAMTAHL